jgi:hypothetical protein
LLKSASTAVLLATSLLATHFASPQAVSISPSTLPRVGTISPRFQSFNIEMVEVTGGRFWAPYKLGSDAESKPDPKLATPGTDPSLYRYRPPINLANPKLRKLAAALAPSYVRVSGTWANSTYFHDSDGHAPQTPPTGFGGILTREEWKGVVDFSKAVDADIVTSFAISPGVRDANGVWTPVEAKKIVDYTHKVGGSIAAAEMFNEPTFAGMGGAPKGYSAETYGKDFKVFHAYASKALPKMIVLGPSSVGEGGAFGELPAGMNLIKSTDMLEAEGPGVEVFSYHFYGGVSKRCAAMGAAAQATPDTALTEQWLSKTDHEEAFYAAMRDKYLPGKPIWLTETGETACGGNPWASTFLDSFRYLNQLGTLAKRQVQVVAHNTLAASDYALIDEDTLNPRPNYWSALLWRKLMGTTVLDAGASAPNVYVYAHCLRNQPGGVAILAINTDRDTAHEINLPEASLRYTLASDKLISGQVALNGVDLMLDSKGNLPTLTGTPTPAGKISLAPTTITFLGVAKANNPACRK